MLHGDISNQAGVTIAFRCEDFLVKYKESSFSDKVMNAIIGKENRADINQTVLSYMEHLYRNTEYNVDVVVTKKEYEKHLSELLADMPFNRVVFIERESQVSSRILTGDISYYVDDDPYRRGLVNSKYAVSFSEISSIINRRVHS